MELFSETPKKQQKVPDNLQFLKKFASNSVKNIMAEFYLGNITQTIFFLEATPYSRLAREPGLAIKGNCLLVTHFDLST